MKQPDPIAQILKAAIKEQGSLYRVAKETGVNYTTAHKWKTGKAHPQGRNLMKLIELAGKKVASISAIAFALVLSGHGVSDVQANNNNDLSKLNSPNSMYYANYY